MELAGSNLLRQESIVLTSSTQIINFSVTMQACNIHMCVKALWFSEIPTATKLPPWFPFLSGYLPISQVIKPLLAVLASYMVYRVLNSVPESWICLNWKNFYFCAQFHVTSGDPFFLFVLFCALRLADTMHKNNALKQWTSCKIQVFYCATAWDFEIQTTRMYIKSFYFHLQW